MKNHTIWNEEINLEDWKDFLMDEYPDVTDEYEQYSICAELNDTYLEDEQANLDIPTDTYIVCIADIGRWNGTVNGARIMGRNINSIFRKMVRGDSHSKWYTDSYDVRGEESHHDGTNYYLFRKMKNGKDFDTMMEKPLTHERILQYTTSILPDVKQVYGW